LNGLIDEKSVTIDKGNPRSLLGKGGFGEVWKGRYRGTEVACKVVKSNLMSKEAEKSFLSEISLLMNLHHSHVVSYVGLANKEGTWMLVQELCSNSMDKVLASERVRRDMTLRIRMLIDAAAGILYLHDKGVIHFDLKPANLLVDASNRVKVVKCFFPF